MIIKLILITEFKCYHNTENLTIALSNCYGNCKVVIFMKILWLYSNLFYPITTTIVVQNTDIWLTKSLLGKLKGGSQLLQ